MYEPPSDPLLFVTVTQFGPLLPVHIGMSGRIPLPYWWSMAFVIVQPLHAPPSSCGWW